MFSNDKLDSNCYLNGTNGRILWWLNGNNLHKNRIPSKWFRKKVRTKQKKLTSLAQLTRMASTLCRQRNRSPNGSCWSIFSSCPTIDRPISIICLCHLPSIWTSPWGNTDQRGSPEQQSTELQAGALRLKRSITIKLVKIQFWYWVNFGLT